MDERGHETTDGARALLEGSETEAGLGLASALAGLDLGVLGPGEAVDATAAWGRVVAWAQAQQARAAARFEEGMVELYGPALSDKSAPTPISREAGARSGPAPRGATELSMRLGLTRQSAGRLIRVGRLLTGPLAATYDALEAGRLCWRKAEVIAAGVEGLALPVLLDVEDAVLPTASGRTPPQLRGDVAKAVASADPEGATERHRVAAARRRVCRPRVLPDGMAQLTAVLPAPDALALDLALEGAARAARADGDARSTDQLRADLLTSVGYEALRSGWFGARGRTGSAATGAARRTRGPGRGDSASGGHPLARVGGTSVRLHVTVPLSTLAGQDDRPGHLAGYGTIDAATARTLASDATLRRIVTDPVTGTVIDVGRTSYRPPAALARLVRARDGTCVRPGCGVAATNCELDHTMPYARGGRTALTNLGALCSTDHRHKSAGDFRVVQRPGGVFDWTSPSGHTYRRERDGSITHRGRRGPPALADEPPSGRERAPRTDAHGRPPLPSEAAASRHARAVVR